MKKNFKPMQEPFTTYLGYVGVSIGEDIQFGNMRRNHRATQLIDKEGNVVGLAIIDSDSEYATRSLRSLMEDEPTDFHPDGPVKVIQPSDFMGKVPHRYLQMLEPMIQAALDNAYKEWDGTPTGEWFKEYTITLPNKGRTEKYYESDLETALEKARFWDKDAHLA